MRFRGVGPAAGVAAAVVVASVLAWPGSANAAGSSFRVPVSADELVVVSAPTAHPSGSIATLRTYSRPNRWSAWQPVFSPWSAEIGRSGMRADRREGDGSTPTGVYGISTSVIYGNDANPGGLHVAYHHLVCGDWWDEDKWSGSYNRFVHVSCGTTPSFAPGSEALWTESQAYPYFAVIDFNTDPVVGGAKAPGSGIFLHNWIGQATEGCVALPESELLDVLRWLRPSDHPVMEIGTTAELGSMPPPAPRLADHAAADLARPGADWLAAAGGETAQGGGAPGLGSPVSTDRTLAGPVTAIASLPAGDGAGYFIGTSAGQLFAFGSARWHGSPIGRHQPIDVSDVAPTPKGDGYLVLGSTGGVQAFGTAHWRGSPAARGEQMGAAGIALSKGARGYWVASGRGRVLAFGAARFFGSPVSRHLRLRSNIVGIVASADGGGYVVATAAGHVYSFGDARFRGSLASRHETGRVLAIDPDGSGYELLVATGPWPDLPKVVTFSG